MTEADSVRVWDRYWHRPRPPARPHMFVRGFLLILSLDLVMTHLGHGARYGHGDFNVAHFRAIDLAFPVGVTASVYVGSLLVCSFLAFVAALAVPKRWTRLLIVGLTTLYTAAWSFSMLDSYQHHYLLSLVLLNICFFPRAHLESPSGEATPNWAWPLVVVTLAIVYGFAAVSKLEAAWLSGEAFLRVAPQALSGLRDVLGLEVATFRTTVVWLSRGVPALQAFVALALVLSQWPNQAPWLKRTRVLAWSAAVLFHLLAEVLGLRVGWFGAYMIWTMTFVLWPYGWNLRWPQGVPESGRGRTAAACLGLFAAVGVGIFGWWVDLPGSIAACGICGALIAVVVAFQLAGGHTLTTACPSYALPLAAGLWCLMSAVTFQISEVRFDYYRFAGGSHARMGQWEQALAAYRKANRYAPAGKNRQAQERNAASQLTR